MNPPAKIIELVDRFKNQYESYKSPSYNETQLRREFLDPFFEVLGWDMDNKAGIAEAYKDVIHEDAIKMGGLTKAPDYCFRIGGTRKFFVEAKKPSINLKDDTSPAFQLKRYAWSAKMPISILTDFEEFVVYETRSRPHQTDSPAKHRISYFKYTDYIDKWNEIATIFSKNSILQGAFDKFAEEITSKRGTSEVDNEFLKEIEKWRELLAKDIAKNNPRLSQRELNDSVQKTIDRIIFLRISEDRGIENYGRLMALQNRQNIYTSLSEIFEEADQKYNSGLFHFREETNIAESADNLTLTLKVSDSVLNEIIKNLYYPDSPYEFSVLPADTLGQVYEQYLGKVIRLTSDHSAVVEDKPEVKKAGGVYYTPTFIVDYIAKNSVGKLLEGKTPKQIEKIKILDPACGSGSFLLQAYEHLLEWHHDYYTTNLQDKYYKSKNPVLYQIGTGDWRLTTAEKRRILLNNIFGVDIDAQAVEVTKLSLLLKVLEGESQETLMKQLKLLHERALPDLGNNIKCGNSLIDNDYFEGQQIDIFNEDERYKINPFAWKREFREIMQKGGFDIVIGNPPYVFGGNYGIEDSEKKYFKSRFKSGVGKINLFTIFIEKSLELLANKGVLSFIIPNTFLRVTSYKKTRAYVLNNSQVKQIVDLGTDVFKKAITSSIILTIQKNLHGLLNNKVHIKYGIGGSEKEIPQEIFRKGNNIFNINNSSRELELIAKLKERSVDLGELCAELIFGIVITKNRNELVSSIKENGFKNFLEGKDIGRYHILPVKKYLNYIPSQIHRPRTPKIFEAKEKLLIQRITGGNYPLKAAYDNQQYYNKESINNIILKKNSNYELKYILGLINSKLINWFYAHEFTNASTLTVNLSKEYLSKIPIKKIDIRNPEEKNSQNKIVALVNQMITLYLNLEKANTNNERTRINRQLQHTDNQIDEALYSLYSLTPEEIEIVEK